MYTFIKNPLVDY